VDLAVVWEMLNKGVMKRKPFVALGEFWRPIIESVRDVERAHPTRWAEYGDNLVYVARTPSLAAEHLARELWRLQQTVPTESAPTG